MQKIIVGLLYIFVSSTAGLSSPSVPPKDSFQSALLGLAAAAASSSSSSPYTTSSTTSTTSSTQSSLAAAAAAAMGYPGFPQQPAPTTTGNNPSQSR